MFTLSEIEYNNNLRSINNAVVCETSITCDHIYNTLDYNTNYGICCLSEKEEVVWEGWV